MPFIVGIFPNAASAMSLIDALKSSGYDPETIRVLTADTATELASLGVEYTWLGDARSPGAGELIMGAGGTSVPGLGGIGAPSLEGTTLDEGLADMAVPDARTDEYATAVEKGQTIVGTTATADNLDNLKSQFTAAGAAKVDIF